MTAVAESGSLNYLLNTLHNCGRLQVHDGPFYDKLMSLIRPRIGEIASHKQMMQLSAFLARQGMTGSTDQESVKVLCEHIHKSRFLLSDFEKIQARNLIHLMKADEFVKTSLDLSEECSGEEMTK